MVVLSSAFPRERQFSLASSSGASLQMTGSAATRRHRRGNFFPIAHPLAIAPAIGAEQGDFLPFQLCSARLEYRVKLAFFQLLTAHGGAAKRHGAKASI